MKKAVKYFGIIMLVMIIGFLFAACGNPSGGGNGGNFNENTPPTNGSLTITGLDDYNGSYVLAMGESEMESMLLAGAGFTVLQAEDDEVFSRADGVKISNGSVTLKVWEGTYMGFKSYSGNDKNVEFNLDVIDRTSALDAKYLADGEVMVNFTNGVASGAAFNMVPIVNVDLGNGITGNLSAYYENDIRLNCNWPYHWETEDSRASWEQDFEVWVNGQLVTFSDLRNIGIWSGQMSFSVDVTSPFIAGESYQIRIKYTPDPARPIKVWIPENNNDEDVPPANAATLESFDTGVKTVTAEEW